MPRKYPLQNDLTGQQFGRLTAIEPVEYVIHWKCICECGNITYARGRNLIDGTHQSCGCLNRDRSTEVHTKHGMARTRQFKMHTNIMQRCYNPNTTNYPRYGGRGITVCQRWQKFENFYQDFGQYRPSDTHSIERIDNDKGYWCGHCLDCTVKNREPNCKWATKKEQARNTSTTQFLTFKDQTKSITEWAEIVGINADTIRNRVFTQHWSTEDALTLSPNHDVRIRKERLPLPNLNG